MKSKEFFPVKNFLTVDLEDWYQTTTYKKKIPVSNWDHQESRLVNTSRKILAILEKAQIKATFFVLAYNALRHPDLIRQIKQEGHELGVHGYHHNLVFEQDRLKFKKEIELSKKIIEETTGEKATGFRAPNWSVNGSCLWAVEVLLELGFRYDSSMDEGILKKVAGKMPKGLLEIPRSSISVLGQAVPFGGGFFLRAYPYAFTKSLITIRNQKGEKTVVYFHPWEFETEKDHAKPVFFKSAVSRFNMNGTERKLQLLLNDFSFGAIREISSNV